ncbi:MAG: hypothetical protein HC769_34625 [Cyanobacteria bacterium CRU_2_1]|nr:hypothetical protein [Cyanobacteria bacterium RU_5_0]NJR63464.1 hypothetical protein [Cyanobacteria bacterium CRU_2_1]
MNAIELQGNDLAKFQQLIDAYYKGNNWRIAHEHFSIPFMASLNLEAIATECFH